MSLPSGSSGLGQPGQVNRRTVHSWRRGRVRNFHTDGRRAHPAQDVYDWATDEIGKMADAGKSVAILCEGDPFFYGSFMYLYSRLS